MRSLLILNRNEEWDLHSAKCRSLSRMFRTDLSFAFAADVLECFVVVSHNLSDESAWILFPEIEQQDPRASEQDAGDK